MTLAERRKILDDRKREANGRVNESGEAATKAKPQPRTYAEVLLNRRKELGQALGATRNSFEVKKEAQKGHLLKGTGNKLADRANFELSQDVAAAPAPAPAAGPPASREIGTAQ